MTDRNTCSVDGCDKRTKRTKRTKCAKCASQESHWCSMHCARMRIHGSFDLPPRKPRNPSARAAEERFFAKVEKTDGCWNWTAGLNRYGYGRFRGADKAVLAHRFAYEFLVGPISSGLQLDHICHNRRCVNPDHLRAVTNKENSENRAKNQSGIRGVHWNKRDKRWSATMTHNGKRIHVGYFNTAGEAEVAVITKRNELFTHNDADRHTA